MNEGVTIQLEAVVAFQLQFVAKRVFLAGTCFGVEHHVIHMEWFVAGDRCAWKMDAKSYFVYCIEAHYEITLAFKR